MHNMHIIAHLHIHSTGGAAAAARAARTPGEAAVQQQADIDQRGEALHYRYIYRGLWQQLNCPSHSPRRAVSKANQT